MIQKIGNLFAPWKALWAAMVLWLAPWVVQACPRCVEATPYRFGLQLAIAVLLPLPFALGFFLYRFFRLSFSEEKVNE